MQCMMWMMTSTDCERLGPEPFRKLPSITSLLSFWGPVLKGTELNQFHSLISSSVIASILLFRSSATSSVGMQSNRKTCPEKPKHLLNWIQMDSPNTAPPKLIRQCKKAKFFYCAVDRCGHNPLGSFLWYLGKLRPKMAAPSQTRWYLEQPPLPSLPCNAANDANASYDGCLQDLHGFISAIYYMHLLKTWNEAKELKQDH